MHSIQLKVDDSIFDKVMTMLELLPQDKVMIEENFYEYPAVTEEEARRKVQKAINNISDGKGLPLDEAFSTQFNHF
jgi:hypothetical protein